MFDIMEPHIWMAQAAGYYDAVVYHYERFDPVGYINLVNNAKRIYMERRDYWDGKLKERIEMCAEWSRTAGKRLITTEWLEFSGLRGLAITGMGLAQTVMRTGWSHCSSYRMVGCGGNP